MLGTIRAKHLTRTRNRIVLRRTRPTGIGLWRRVDGGRTVHWPERSGGVEDLQRCENGAIPIRLRARDSSDDVNDLACADNDNRADTHDLTGTPRTDGRLVTGPGELADIEAQLDLLDVVPEPRRSAGDNSISNVAIVDHRVLRVPHPVVTVTPHVLGNDAP